MNKQDLFLVLGCFGFREDDFISCSGIENRILLLDSTLVYYDGIMNYLEVCRLFDKPLFDYNSIRHCLFNLRDQFEQPTRRLWSEKRFHSLEKFTIEHRHCGLILKLLLTEEPAYIPPRQEPEIFIKGEGASGSPANKIAQLRLIRK